MRELTNPPMVEAPWQPGDRVSLVLPDKSLPWGRAVRISGTVTEVDRPGIPRGVFVHLDRFINGIDTCHATHGELRREL